MKLPASALDFELSVQHARLGHHNEAWVRRRVIVILNEGIGNRLLATSLLHSLTAAKPDWSIELWCTPAPDGWQTPLASNLRERDISVDATWRRFRRADWTRIADYLRCNAVDLVINLRKEDPAYDRDYIDFRQHMRLELEFWDLHELSTIEVANTSFVQQALALLVKKSVHLHLATQASRPTAPLGTTRIGIFVGASQSTKRWRREAWQELIEDLLDQCPDVEVMVATGLSTEERLSRQQIFQRAFNGRAFPVELDTLGELVRWISGLDALVACDTAAVHAGYALGIPTVGVYLSTLASIWGPGVPSSIAKTIQSPIGESCPCMRINGTCSRLVTGCPAPCHDAVRPQTVLKLVRELLDHSSDAHGTGP